MKTWQTFFFLAFLVITITACEANHNTAYSTEEVVKEVPVKTEVLPTAAEPTDAGPDLNQIQTNISAFTRLYGIVRYYHPSDTAKAADWNAFAVSGIKFVQCAADTDDLIFRLNTLFQALAPTVSVFPTGADPEMHHALTLPPDAANLSVIRWENQGLAGLGSTNLYTSRRNSEPIIDGIMPADFKAPQDAYQTELSAGISAFIPTTLFYDGEFTLPYERAADPVHLSSSCLSEKVSAHLADVTVSWNILQHSYPYFDLADSDWEDVLGQTIMETISTEDSNDFMQILRKMLAHLDDGLASVNNPAIHDVFIPRIKLGWVEDQIIVISVNDSSLEGVQPGDKVVGIGTQPLDELIYSLPESISGATDQWIRERFLIELLRGKQDTSIVLKIETQSFGVRSYLAERNLAFWNEDHASNQKLHEIKPGVFYLDLTRLTLEEFKAALPELETASGIIMDLRGTPKLPFTILGHFTDQPLETQQFHLPNTTLPDQVDVRWNIQTEQVFPTEPQLIAKLILLADGSSIGYAETFLYLASAWQVGDIAGSPSAGTNGNMNLIITPSGFEITWTGLKTVNQDGSQFHGIGVQPTIPAERTIEGVRDGRDEVLEKALEYLQ